MICPESLLASIRKHVVEVCAAKRLVMLACVGFPVRRVENGREHLILLFWRLYLRIDSESRCNPSTGPDMTMQKA